MIRILNSLPLLYAVMLIPAWPLFIAFFDDTAYFPQLMYGSGLWAVYFLIFTVAVSPSLLIINRIGYGAPVGRWLLKRRRHLGLASAIYAGLHVVHYLLYSDDLATILAETLELKYALGWLAFVIMVALAVTSNNWSVKNMGRRWKALHLLIYPAAALTYLHWYLFDWFTARVMFWVAIFCGVKLAHRLIKLIPRRAGSPGQTRAS